MPQFDGKALGDQIVASVREFVSKAFATVSNRCDDLEARIKTIPAGPRGEPGENGAPADPLVTRALVIDLVEKVAAEMPRPKDGEPGKDGENGRDGKDGINGKDGELGKDGAKGDPGGNGKDGVDGLNGKDGINGKDGKEIHPDTVALMVTNEIAKAIATIPKAMDGANGDPGRDALDLVILPSIDETKSYPRGTWASHIGGLWKAVGVTNGMAGWEVMVDGLASITATGSDNARLFTFEMKQASGRVVEIPVAVPTMIYQDIWKEGRYEHGDCVTRDGSLWHCQKDTTGTPGVSPDWRLCVKRGAHGKDAKG